MSPDRREGILVISGGLLVHNLRDFSSFSETSANALVKEFNQAIMDAVTIKDVRSFYSNPSFSFSRLASF